MAPSVSPSLAGLVLCSLRYIRAYPPRLGGNSQFVIRIVGCFSTFSLPLTHCLPVGWKGLYFSLSPSQILLLITFQTLSRIDFHSLRRLLLVCLRQRVSWSENCVSQSSCDGIIPYSSPTGSIFASGWRWESQLRADLGSGLTALQPCGQGEGLTLLGKPPGYFVIEMGLKSFPFNDQDKATKRFLTFFLFFHCGRRNYPFELCMG